MLNFINEKVLNAVTANATRTSRIIDIRQCNGFSVQTFGTTVGGTVSILVQASNDTSANAETDSFWTTISTVSVSAGTTNAMVDFSNRDYAYLRFRLTQTGGSGTVTVILNAK